MRNLLGEYVRRAREAKGLSRGELPKLMGYRNLQKGARRLYKVETGEIPDGLFLDKLISALDLDRERVYEYIETMEAETEAEFQAWLDHPVPMKLILRYAPCAYFERALPEHVTSEESAIQYACEVAREKGVLACLVLNRRWSVWISQKGEVYLRSEASRRDPNMPYVQVKGDKRKAVISRSDDGPGLKPAVVEEFDG